jgi:hypothetical protein
MGTAAPKPPYVTALYAPVAIPSPDHAPPPAPGERWEPGDAATNVQRWADNQRAWNDRALERVNHNRSRRGLALIDDVLRHNITDHPWLATDATLAPIPATPGMKVFETGAWILEDSTPLPRELADFLDAGEPPIYLGFGSMPAPQGVSRGVSYRELARRQGTSCSTSACKLGARGAVALSVCQAVDQGSAGSTATGMRTPASLPARAMLPVRKLDPLGVDEWLLHEPVEGMHRVPGAFAVLLKVARVQEKRSSHGWYTALGRRSASRSGARAPSIGRRSPRAATSRETTGATGRAAFAGSAGGDA